MRRIVEILVAATQQGGIGGNGRLLWHIPEDLALFKKHTTDGTVIMGRKTYESLPEKHKPLPRRRNIILSRSGFVAPGVEVVQTLEALAERLTADERVYVIGGEDIYTLFMTPNPWFTCHQVHMTEVDAPHLAPMCDRAFPLQLLHVAGFVQTECSAWKLQPDTNTATTIRYRFVLYTCVSAVRGVCQ